ESIAVFTEWTYDVTDALSLTAGVRYTEDDKSMQGYIWNIFPATAPDPSPLPTLAIPDGGPLFIYPDRFNETFDKVTGSASIQYTFDNGWMVYGSYSSSFKSGGFNQRFNAPPRISCRCRSRRRRSSRSSSASRRISPTPSG